MVIGPGARGRAVRDIQQRLLALGYIIEEAERHDSYGPSTAEAVRAFQQQRGLIVDGIVGPYTWRELVEASWRLGDRVLYLRSPNIRGDDVRELQERLSELGFDPGRIDGIFGGQAATAVRDFQRNYGLPEDGLVAVTTLRALAGLPHLGHPSVSPVTQIRERESLRHADGMAGLRVVIDPGHGGADPGIVGPSGVRESDAMFAIARELEAALGAGGAAVYMTRDADASPSDRERAALANDVGADIVIALHAASHGDAGAAGAATYYYGNERFASERGARLADLVQAAVSELGLTNGRTHAKTWPLLRETRMPAVQLEPCYLTNPEEERRLADPGFHRRLAAAVSSAVRTFASSPVLA